MFGFNTNPASFLQLCRSVSKESMNCVTALLSSINFSMNVTDEHGNTPLHCWFTSSAWDNVAEFFKFLAAGADIHAKNVFGQTPWDMMLNCAAWLREHSQLLHSDGCNMLVQLSEAMCECRERPLSDYVDSLIADAPPESHVDENLLFEAIGFGLLLGWHSRREGMSCRADEFARIGKWDATFNVRRFRTFLLLPGKPVDTNHAVLNRTCFEE
jgi:hypothetical protein